MESINDKLYTIEEVSKILNMSAGTIRNKMSSGEINFIKVFGSSRIYQSEVNRILGKKEDPNDTKR